MNTRKLTPAKRPEDIIRDALVAFLKVRNWYVKILHGNAFQSGVPDLYATHLKFGGRFIEVKVPGKLRWEPSQILDFPLLVANGTGVWVLTAATEEEYRKLFAKCNLHEMLMLSHLKARGIS